jgi:signal transduction histidine kinase
MNNMGNKIASLAQVCKYLAGVAEKKGVEIYTGFSVDELLYDEKRYFGYGNELKQIVIVLLNDAKDILQTRNICLGKIDVRLKEEKGYVVIDVCDNGRGMTQKLMQKVFEPYFTTKHKSQGTGLGLYMSQKMIQNRFDGEIKVKNVEDGICFSIYLPKGVC